MIIKCIELWKCALYKLSPPQSPPTVAPTRGARRLGRGKIKARGERFLSPALPLPVYFFTDRSLCGGESYIKVSI